MLLAPTILALFLSAPVSVVPAPAASTTPAATVATPAPKSRSTLLRFPMVQAAAVAGALGLVMGLPLLTLSTVAAAVAGGSMVYVLWKVQDWKSGKFDLNEDDITNRDNTQVTRRRMWAWGRNSLSFSILGMTLGVVLTSIGAASLLAGLVATPAE